MKKVNLISSVLVVTLLFILTQTTAQTNPWRNIKESEILKNDYTRTIHPNKFQTLHLNVPELKLLLATAPMEFTTQAKQSPVILSIPMPDGSFSRFSIVESPMQEPELAAKFPEIKTYSGQGIDDRYATLKADWTVWGFHAQIISMNHSTVYVDPYSKGNTTIYMSYFQSDVTPYEFSEYLDASALGDIAIPATYLGKAKVGTCGGDTLRTYRFAMACTFEYSKFVCNPGPITAAGVHGAIMTTMSRVNGLYEKDIDIRLILVGNNNKIEFRDSASSPLLGRNTVPTLFGVSNIVIRDSIGNANYDLGHTLGSGQNNGNGGVIGGTCDSATKGLAVTCGTAPTGATFDIDYMAHEIGHQLGGNHTFNASGVNGCTAAARNAGTAVEPGSGVTIMSYAGICGTENLQANAIPFFHATSIQQILTYARARGNSCAVKIATGNGAPVVNAGNDYQIPSNTPFMLTGTATDPDGDALSYSWEEIDPGVAGNWNAGEMPYFRSFNPVANGTRVFPKMSDVVRGTATIGEFMCPKPNALNFRLTARDGRAAGGGVCSEDVAITVNGTDTFKVTTQSTATNWRGNRVNTDTIRWKLASTNAAPINCANVMILFSRDSGYTFTDTLLRTTPNNGLAVVTIPQLQGITQGRIMVKSIGNVFFNLNSGIIRVDTCATPTVTIKVNDTTTICGGSKKLTFSVVTLTNVTTPVYQWKKNGANVGTNATTFTDTSFADKDSIWVVVTSAVTCKVTGMASVKIKIKVRAIKPIALTCPLVTLCGGDTARLTATPAGGVWSSANNRAAVNATGLVTGANTVGTATITYTINDSGCTNSASCAIPITSRLNVPSFVFAAGTVDPQRGAAGGFCNGRTFTLVGTPAGGVWATSNNVVFTVTNLGVVNTVGIGTGTLTYTVGTGGCANSRSITGNVVTCASRGVNGISNDQFVVSSDFIMFPNPAKTFISLSVNSLIGTGTIIVTDLYGKQMKSQALSMGNNTVDLSRLSKGIYFVSMITNEGKTTKKLVVE